MFVSLCYVCIELYHKVTLSIPMCTKHSDSLLACAVNETQNKQTVIVVRKGSAVVYSAVVLPLFATNHFGLASTQKNQRQEIL